LKVKRFYLDLTEPRIECEWRRAVYVTQSVDGWLDVEEERWLFEQAYSLPDRANIIEIGSFKGRSTSFLASGCRGTKKRVSAIDTFNGNDSDFGYRGFFQDFERNIRHCGVAKYVKPVVGKSCEIARTWNLPIDLLFIDGSHVYEDVLADFRGFFPHVVPGGLVAFHDVRNPERPGVARAWEELTGQVAETAYCGSIGFGRKPK
jgi:predicted O-methyltransferase YrrM